MSNPVESKEEHLGDFWFSNWERQCEHEIENEPDLDEQLEEERDLTKQKLWYQFQNSAAALAQLFKDRNQSPVVWVPFQAAAGTVTSLYKESTEAVRRVSELGHQAGSQRRTRDILAWAKKRRRHIMREELISFLAGKNMPASGASQPRQRGGPRPRLCIDNPTSHAAPLGVALESLPGFEPDLQTFREALNTNSRRRGSPGHNSELSTFVATELARHKRPAPPSPSNDVIMDSPTHKRQRFM